MIYIEYLLAAVATALGVLLVALFGAVSIATIVGVIRDIKEDKLK